MANEFDIPQELIHHIQSFLNSKQSCQTSILSKSWYNAWLTQPVLTFDEYDFHKTENVDAVLGQFSQFSMNTINRYKSLNLKADKFVIRMKERMKSSHGSRGYYALADVILSAASELSVSEIDFKLINYFIINRRWTYFSPIQVFELTSLTRLTIDRCVIKQFIGNKVLCSRLTSLVLSCVFTSNYVISGILAGCPLIENLVLSTCIGLERLNVSKLPRLVSFRIFAMTLSVNVEFDNGIDVTEFLYLRRLKFREVIIGDDFFTKFSSMFPYIEDFSLGISEGYKEVKIASHSLKRLSLCAGQWMKKVQLNIPNISKTEWVENRNDTLPSLSVGSVLRDWESDVKLLCIADVIEAYWFEELREFLTALSLSKISLHITFAGKSIIPGEEIPCFPSVPMVENLTVCACSSSNTAQNLSLCLSKSCCPKLITRCICKRNRYTKSS